jgi:hypothetical protein
MSTASSSHRQLASNGHAQWGLCTGGSLCGEECVNKKRKGGGIGIKFLACSILALQHVGVQSIHHRRENATATATFPCLSFFFGLFFFFYLAAYLC